jgi:hypothetical protein
MAHIVKATLIVAKVGDTEQYFEKGVALPDGVSAEERKRLAADGLVEYVKDPAKAETAKSDDKS